MSALGSVALSRGASGAPWAAEGSECSVSRTNESSGWEYGVLLADVKSMVARWRAGYNWRHHEALSAWVPHFSSALCLTVIAAFEREVDSDAVTIDTSAIAKVRMPGGVVAESVGSLK
ncbi:hypothetical protein B0H14DRAFT_3582652 [Mycena olivaceomarginata]|nr:hypothetical protein B0H14DRAFT_3582652 [Mycena olivaceomarginata]